MYVHIYIPATEFQYFDRFRHFISNKMYSNYVIRCLQVTWVPGDKLLALPGIFIYFDFGSLWMGMASQIPTHSEPKLAIKYVNAMYQSGRMILTVHTTLRIFKLVTVIIYLSRVAAKN